LRLESNYAGPLNWQAGLYWFDEDYKVESFSYDSLAGSKQDGYQRVRQKNEAYALFGAVNWRRRTGLQAARRPALHAGQEGLQRRGLRELGLRALRAVGQVHAGAAGGQEPDGNLSAAPKDNKLSWDLSGTYTLDKDTNVYARVATGFRAAACKAPAPSTASRWPDPRPIPRSRPASRPT
jgi:iron complex outermembrane receptor protein